MESHHSELFHHSTPPEGSVLGRILDEHEKTCLELLHWMQIERKLACAVAETHATIATLRAQQHCDYLSLHKLSEFAPYTSAPTSRNDEPLFTYEWVVQHKTLGFGNCFGFLNTDGAPVVAVRFTGGKRKDSNVRVFRAEAAYWVTPLCDGSEQECAPTPTKQPDCLPNTTAGTRSNANRDVLQDVASTESGFAHVAGICESKSAIKKVLLVDAFTNWCPHRGAYVQQDHVCAFVESGGENPCVEEDAEVQQEKTLENYCSEFKKVKKASGRTKPRGSTPMGRNLAEDRLLRTIETPPRKRLLSLCESLAPYMPDNVFEIACSVPFKTAWKHLTAFKRWLTEAKMVAQHHPNAPPTVRSLEKILLESKYFPS